MAKFNILSGRLSKHDCLRFANDWAKSPNSFKEVLLILKTADLNIVYNASWVFRTVAVSAPQLFEENFNTFFELISQFKSHEGIIRNFIGVLQDIKIPNSFEGKVYDYCFSNIISKNTPIAARVFSMSVCYNISLIHKDLIPELKETISSILESYGSTSGAIYSRGNKILKKLRR